MRATQELWLMAVMILVLTTNTASVLNLKRTELRTNLENALCSDGETAESAASDLLSSLRGNVKGFVDSVRELQDLPTRSDILECRRRIDDMYLDPSAINATLALMVSYYGPNDLPHDLAGEFRSQLRQNRGDSRMERFIEKILEMETQ